MAKGNLTKFNKGERKENRWQLEKKKHKESDQMKRKARKAKREIAYE